MDIYDEVSRALVETGITVNSDSYALPAKYRDTI